ncbi:hypothetical protein L2E82_11244 [Cichorium intybus]|uniref:Uncharacterized protein n=1 Tax=Cichorium intybus TaxID=13427 RepID=A0ACB9GDW7_CICIN|nr:hypothetical protein L2E82_11244 [Cichorium intybus]
MAKACQSFLLAVTVKRIPYPQSKSNSSASSPILIQTQVRPLLPLYNPNKHSDPAFNILQVLSHRGQYNGNPIPTDSNSPQ